MDDAGNFVVVWHVASDGDDGDDVLLRQFQANDSPLDDALVVNTTTAGAIRISPPSP